MPTLKEIKDRVQRHKPLVDLIDTVTTTSGGGSGIHHDALIGITPDQHHAQVHILPGTDHIGELSDMQHGSRTKSDAHRNQDITDAKMDDLGSRLDRQFLDEACYGETTWDASGRLSLITFYPDLTKARKLYEVSYAYS